MRKSFTLLCENKKIGQGEWRFRRREGGMDLFDPDGELVDSFGHDEANNRFTLPSFWRSVKNITYITRKGAVLEFQPDAEDVRIVRQYLDDALMAGGVEAIASLRTRAWLSTAGGAALLVVSIVALFLADQVFRQQDQQGGKRFGRAFFVGMIVGVALLAWGISGVIRAARLMRRYDEDE